MCYTGRCAYEDGHSGECTFDRNVIPPDDSECAIADRYADQAEEYRKKRDHRRNILNKNFYLIKRIEEAGL